MTKVILGFVVAIIGLIGVTVSGEMFGGTTTAYAHGCTYTPGYWKNHLNVDHNLPHSYTSSSLVSGFTEEQLVVRAIAILKYDPDGDGKGDASDPIAKLLRNLLAASLNTNNNADGSTLFYQTEQAAINFLITHPYGTTLTAAEKTMVLAWSDLLDRYNNGDRTLSPGHCR